MGNLVLKQTVLSSTKSLNFHLMPEICMYGIQITGLEPVNKPRIARIMGAFSIEAKQTICNIVLIFFVYIYISMDY